MLINVSYFTAGPRMIANATCGTESSQVNDYILGFIADLQLPFLVELLGDEVGNEVHGYLCELDEDPDAERIGELDELCKRLRHSFADYVFYKILGDSNTLATINGLVEVKNANKIVSPLPRQVDVWNVMVKRNKMLRRWCESEDCRVSGIVFGTGLLTPINRFNL